MEKIEEFKSFVRSHPTLVNRVHAKEFSWQQLYELFDIHGPSYELFKEKEIQNKEKETPDLVHSALKMFQGLDVDKLNENLQGVKKVLGLFTELSKASEKKVETPKARNPFRRYHD